MAEPLAYNTNLRADIRSSVGDDPKARVHSREWVKVMNGDPVEINPSVGFGYKVQAPARHQSRPRKSIAQPYKHRICMSR